jgi:hypothetical protein
LPLIYLVDLSILCVRGRFVVDATTLMREAPLLDRD